MDDATKAAVRELATYVIQHGTATQRAIQLSAFLLSQVVGLSHEEIVATALAKADRANANRPE